MEQKVLLTFSVTARQAMARKQFHVETKGHSKNCSILLANFMEKLGIHAQQIKQNISALVRSSFALNCTSCMEGRNESQ